MLFCHPLHPNPYTLAPDHRPGIHNSRSFMIHHERIQIDLEYLRIAYCQLGYLDDDLGDLLYIHGLFSSQAGKYLDPSYFVDHFNGGFL